ncbi:cysteine hydrolase family protein [Lysinibacillus capsici]|uniref:cysteine hydrolase family protein n=1 Tax=Lysinibacillus capsici TaxID=2115968 RepID=UPI002730E728|nr:cysteine hydrolase family protein [Lysinibacillus capsici]MDP1395538.1 cysteine hydrolase family protein [Lysinibacillus capsici]MDP1416029.1 cysteine hydrolase family protein [Lysinibacillus capsici]MDP1431900.1 cysteine hydrolase family protein [Lysinibacillus capsici]
MKQALIIIDIQEAFFLDGQQNLWNSEAIIKNINASITWARRNEVPVIFIQHTDADDVDFALGQPRWELYHGLLRQAEDQVIQKTTWDAFYQTELAAYLQAHHIDQLIFAGAQTEFCLDTTIRSAFSHGYHHNILIEDAHSTLDSNVLAAPQIIQHHESIWHNRFVRIQSIGGFQHAD